MAWTEEKREQVVSLFNSGHSANDIARIVGGITRNAVLGQIGRLRLRGVAVRAGQPSRGRVFVLETPKTKSQPKKPMPLPGRDIEAPQARRKEDGSPIGTLDLGTRDCRWPHGDVGTDGFHYCANKKIDGSPYCEYHAARAWTPHKTRKAA